MQSTSTNKTTVLERIASEDVKLNVLEHISKLELSTSMDLAASKKTKNKTWHKSLSPSYPSKLSLSFGIKGQQVCQTSKYDAKTFVFGDDSWSWSWSGVGAPRPARLGTWTSFSNINGCQIIVNITPRIRIMGSFA